MKTHLMVDTDGRHGLQGVKPRGARWSPAWGVASLCCFCLADVPAATVTLQQGVNGFTGASDAWLDESLKTRNYGGSTYVQVQYNSGMSDCALLRFPLPALGFQSLTTATLGLYYYDQSSMQANNAVSLLPYRIQPGMGWFENTYDGTAGYGVNWRYRDAAETLTWTSEYGAWYDKLDDGNSTAKIKRPGGSVPDAIAPPAWITWNVWNSVAQWYGGQANNGFVLFESGFEGGGFLATGLFYSREFGTSSLRPYLTLGYAGAQIGWTGQASAVWDASAANWNVGGYRGNYGNGDHVTFADGASNPWITVGGAGVLPGSITISNTATTYGFSGGSIGGSGGLTKAGSGSATLSAGNSYAGLTLIQGGQLIAAANGALGGTGSGTVISNGAALGFLGSVDYSATEPLTVSGGGISGSGVLYAVSGGDNTFAGGVTLAGSSTVGVGSGLGLTFQGAVSGGFDLTKTGGGVLTFGGASANTYAGSTLVNQGTLILAKSAGTAVPNALVIGNGLDPATVRLDAPAQLCATGSVTVNPSGQLDLHGFDGAIGGLTLADGTVASGAGTLTLNGPVTCSGGLNSTISGNLRLGGVVQQFTVSPSSDLIVAARITDGGLTKRGGGRLLLSGDNRYDGGTVVDEGTLLVNNDPDHSWGVGPGSVLVNAGAVLGGRGSIWGPMTVARGGTLNPGASVGTLVISNRVQLQSGSRYQVEVSSTVLAAGSDALDLRNGGELMIEDGALLGLHGALTGGNPFVIVRQATGIHGHFWGLPEGTPLAPPNAAWFIHYRAHAVYLGQNAAPLRYFRAFSTNGVVLVAWRTAIELDTIGFELFRWEEGPGWIRVNAKPIPPQNPNGAAYLLVDAGGPSGKPCRYRLDEHVPGGTESWEFERTPTEFAFSAPPRPVEGGVELRWLSRVDETYDLLGTPDLNLPMLVMQRDLPATPPECAITNVTLNPQGYYWLRLVP